MAVSFAGHSIVQVDVTSTSQSSPTAIDTGGPHMAIIEMITSDTGTGDLYVSFPSNAQFGTVFFLINATGRNVNVVNVAGPMGDHQGLMFVKASSRWLSFPYDVH